MYLTLYPARDPARHELNYLYGPRGTRTHCEVICSAFAIPSKAAAKDRCRASRAVSYLVYPP